MIVVTGGAGFIGSHLVDDLVSLGHSVEVIDDLSAISNDEFYYNDKAVYHKVDILNEKMLNDIFKSFVPKNFIYSVVKS